jgi:hypothetical protein
MKRKCLILNGALKIHYKFKKSSLDIKFKKDRRDSYFIRQLAADDNDTTIKYHTKAPEQLESLKKIKYRDVLQHLEALLDYEHKYRIKLPLERTISQSCMDQIQSRFNISPKQFHGSSLAQILIYLSTICTPSTRQEMITFLTMYSGSLCNVTKVPTASNISYFVHALQDHRRKFVRLLEFISFDPRSVQVMPLENFKKDPPGLWLIIQNSLPFSWHIRLWHIRLYPSPVQTPERARNCSEANGKYVYRYLR